MTNTEKSILLELRMIQSRQNWLLEYLAQNGKDSLYQVVLDSYAVNLKNQETQVAQLNDLAK